MPIPFLKRHRDSQPTPDPVPVSRKPKAPLRWPDETLRSKLPLFSYRAETLCSFTNPARSRMGYPDRPFGTPQTLEFMDFWLTSYPNATVSIEEQWAGTGLYIHPNHKDIPRRATCHPEEVLGVAATMYALSMDYLHSSDPELYSDEAWDADVAAHEFVQEMFTGLVTALAARRDQQAALTQIDVARNDLVKVGATVDPQLLARMAQEASAKQDLLADYDQQITAALTVFEDVARARGAQARAVEQTRLTSRARQAALAAVETTTPSSDPRLLRLSAVSSLVADRTLGALESAEAEIERQKQIRRSL